MGDATPHRRLILASRSPRRAGLLCEAGFVFEQVDPPFADPPQPEAGDPEMLAVNLAAKKSVSILKNIDLHSFNNVLVLGADTICVGADGSLLGQPVDLEDARAMIRGFVAAEHDVVTGIALAGGNGVIQETLADRATVRFGPLPPKEIKNYLATGAWRDKAGGYNLTERQQAGWPITVQGDPTTVVGLPMRKLVPLLAKRGILPTRGTAAVGSS